MKKRTMMTTTDLCFLSMLIPQWKTMKGEEQTPDEPADDLGRVISDARQGCDTEKERLQFDQML
jgi:hypothetical protein